MRHIINLNANWVFSKEAQEVPAVLPSDWEALSLPHSWNAVDGQDGGNDYFRGTAYYAKTITKAELPEAECYYLELRGANSSADVYVNGNKLAHHDGGYSTWRVNITDQLETENLIVIAVDNAPNDFVYPQVADFTFYGGLYRDVNIIAVPSAHFDLDYFGGPGLQVTPVMDGDNANVEVKAFVTNMEGGQTLRYTLYDKEENEVASVVTTDLTANFVIENAQMAWP